MDTQEGRVTSFFLTALYRRPAFFFFNGKKNLKRNFPKSKKKVDRKKKKSRSEKIIQNLEEAEEKRLRTSKGKESMNMNKDSKALEVKEEEP